MSNFYRDHSVQLHEQFQLNYGFGSFPSLDQILESEVFSDMLLWEMQSGILRYIEEVYDRCPSPGPQMECHDWAVRLHLELCRYCLNYVEQYGIDE